MKKYKSSDNVMSEDSLKLIQKRSTTLFKLYRKMRNGTEVYMASCEAIGNIQAKSIFITQHSIENDEWFDLFYKIEQSEITPMEKFMDENRLGTQDMINDI